MYPKDKTSFPIRAQMISKMEIIPHEFQLWLMKNGFAIAPASAGHHSAYSGGLFDHSFQVFNTLVHLTEKLDLRWEREESPLIIGLFHDLCKIDQYIQTSSYEDTWAYNKKVDMPGHGEKSIILLQKFMVLTDEEIACIRWHMGAFDEKENWQYYSRAIEKYPNVLYTHTADMIATHIEEKSE